jgi:L-arabinose isomerase
MQHRYSHLRIGLLGLGLDTYWPQFEGLQDRLLGYLRLVQGELEHDNRTISNFGLVDTYAKAVEAGHACRTDDIDILFVYVTTYALSSTVLPVIQRAKVPVVLLNLAPGSAMDYGAFNRMTNRTAMTGEWLAYCSACPVPEIANVLRRLDIPFHQITGVLTGDEQCWMEIEEWLIAATVAKTLAHSRLGLMGHYYSGMLDIATDLTQVSGRFGLHVQMLEVDRLSALRRDVSDEDTKQKLMQIDATFALDADCDPKELSRAANTAVALERLVEEESLDMLAYYYMGTGVPENENTMSSIIVGTSLLTGSGIPVAGEYEVKNVIAMKILNLLNVGGSFTEYYAMDFHDDVVLMGHDGPCHPRIAQDRIRLRPLQIYHGKVGSGLSVEMAVKHGPVTLLSIVEDRTRGFRFLVAEGESVAGPILEIGNTNSRYRFSLGARGFTEAWNAEGPAHHCAIGTGHCAKQLRKVAELLNIGFNQIC